MRRYTITKTLALLLGVLSVVARNLPERRSEINVRSPGDVGNPKQHLEKLDLVEVSEGVLDGNIHTATYSMSNSTTFPKRDTTPEKPIDLFSHPCSIQCLVGEEARANSDDCRSLYEFLGRQQGPMNFVPNFTNKIKHGGCEIAFANPSTTSTFTSTPLEFAGWAASLTSACIIGQNSNYGVCAFSDSAFDATPSVIVAHTSFFT